MALDLLRAAASGGGARCRCSNSGAPLTMSARRRAISMLAINVHSRFPSRRPAGLFPSSGSDILYYYIYIYYLILSELSVFRVPRPAAVRARSLLDLLFRDELSWIAGHPGSPEGADVTDPRYLARFVGRARGATRIPTRGSWPVMSQLTPHYGVIAQCRASFGIISLSWFLVDFRNRSLLLAKTIRHLRPLRARRPTVPERAQNSSGCVNTLPPGCICQHHCKTTQGAA